MCSICSTDEDARQAMNTGGGRIKEVQVKLLLSSRSEMHKVIETARQAVSFMQLASQPALPAQPTTTHTSLPTSLSGLLAQNFKHLGLPAPVLPSPLPNVIEPPKIEAQSIIEIKDTKRVSKGSDRKQRSRSSSRDRSKKDRGRDKKEKRDRSRSRDRSRDRDRRRRDRSRSRERRDRKRDTRKERSRDRERSKEKSESRSSFRNEEKKLDVSLEQPKANIPLQQIPKQMFQQPILGIRPPGPGPLLTHNDPRRQFGVGAAPMMNMPNMLSQRPPFINQAMNLNPQMGWPQNQQNMNPRMQMPPKFSVPPANSPLINMFPQVPNKANNTEDLHRLQDLSERRNPNAFQNPEPIQKHSPPPNAQDPRQRLNTYNDMNFQKNNNSLRPPPPQNNFEDEHQPFQQDHRKRGFINKGVCIKITNLPTHTGYGDIRRFFVGQYISGHGLKMINDETGRRTGTAFVKFIKPESKIDALRKSGKSLKGELVTIKHMDEEEFESGVDNYQPGGSQGSMDSGEEDTESQKNLVIVEQEDKLDSPFKVLFLEDLPPFAKEHDIMKMFSDYSLLSILLTATKDFRKQYIAYVQFVNADDAKAALNNKSKHLIGHKTIRVSSCSEVAYQEAKTEIEALQNIQDSNDAETEPEPVEEEPPVVQSRDPRQRRSENPRVENNVPFNNGGAFPNPGVPAIHSRFQWRNNNPNQYGPGGDREGRPPMMPRGMDMGPPMGAMPHNNNFDRNNGRFNEVRLDCVILKGLPLHFSDTDIIDFFSPVGVVPVKIHLMLTLQGEPSGDCFCEFLEPEEAAEAVTKTGTVIDTHTVTVDLVPKSVVDEALGIPQENTNNHFGPPMRGFRGGRGGFIPRGRGRGMRGRDFSGRGDFSGGRGGRFNNGPPPNMNQNDNTVGPDNFGNPGCVVSLENVPFRSGIDEILEFFNGFTIAQSDVIRRFNDNGHPTGDARVSFRTPFDAQRAVKQLNQQCIRDRPITLRVL